MISSLNRLVCVSIAYLNLDMRKDVQDIFMQTPHEKQVLMFSATLSKEVRPICKKFMQKVCRILIILSSCSLLKY